MAIVSVTETMWLLHAFLFQCGRQTTFGTEGESGVAAATRNTDRREMTSLTSALQGLPSTPRLPALFIGHGSPMNAIVDNAFSRGWASLGEALPRPRAILVISAHWMTRGTSLVNVAPKPVTIHDFGGFPKALHDVEYPAPGAPDVARAAAELVRDHHLETDARWGLDHGAWSVLVHMFPKADVPTFQLSLDLDKSPAEHFALASELKALRERGVLIVASGNLVHNLRAVAWDNGPAADWAVEFDALVAKAIGEGDYGAVIDIERSHARLTRMAHPTTDHLWPVLYPLAASDKADSLSFFNEGIDLGSISMRSFMLA
jgi:4,5-DOPA dioxygenase extradiol